MKKEEILNKYSFNYGNIKDNPRSIVLSSEAILAMDEWGLYVAEQTWKVLMDKRNITFKEFWTEFKSKENGQITD